MFNNPYRARSKFNVGDELYFCTLDLRANSVVFGLGKVTQVAFDRDGLHHLYLLDTSPKYKYANELYKHRDDALNACLHLMNNIRSHTGLISMNDIEISRDIMQ